MIAFAKTDSVTNAANNFGVLRAMASWWNANVHELTLSPAIARKLGSGPNPPFPEDQLLLTTFAKGGLLDTQYPVVNYKSKMRQVVNEQRFCEFVAG